MFDILGLGCVAVDDLIYVESYPPPDAKTPVLRAQRQCGGLTATALVAAARLGSTCAYAGVLGDDDLSSFAIKRMRQEGIDLTHMLSRPGTGPVHSFIVVDEARQTRNIFFDASRAAGADSGWPTAEIVQSARVLFVDTFGMEAMLRAARLARQARIPVVADFERAADPRFPELLAIADHLILSQNFAEELTGTAEPAGAAKALWTGARQVVIVTGGAKGCWYLGGNESVKHQPAFKVQTVDTTGCGDVFHGAYASALARSLGLEDRIRFASAAAALKATQPGGQLGIPNRAAVESLLQAPSARANHE
jgi:sulfofructose kinase